MNPEAIETAKYVIEQKPEMTMKEIIDVLGNAVREYDSLQDDYAALLGDLVEFGDVVRERDMTYRLIKANGILKRHSNLTSAH